MIELTLRVIFSLAVVLFLMWGLARLVRRPLGGRSAGTLSVLARQHLSRNASVAVVKVDNRAFVLGVTEAQVNLLAETDLAAFEPATATAPGPEHQARHAAPGTELEGRPLAGSALSAATWSQAIEFLRDRTSRPR
jgi:flagellar protein FliO/FliZ